MFDFFKARVATLVAERGRVACPSRGDDTDIDVCFECPHLKAIVREQEGTVVRCTPARRKLPGTEYWGLATS